MDDFWTIFAALATALTMVSGAYAFGRSNGYQQAMLDLNNERETRRFTEIYAPIMGYFTTCHITTCNQGTFYIQQRILNACKFLFESKPLLAFRTLFNKQDLKVYGEVEFGEPFPLATVTKHLNGREQFADRELISLVASANRAQYEDRPKENGLTKADLDLFGHVCRQHEILARRFIRAC